MAFHYYFLDSNIRSIRKPYPNLKALQFVTDVSFYRALTRKLHPLGMCQGLALPDREQVHRAINETD